MASGSPLPKVRDRRSFSGRGHGASLERGSPIRDPFGAEVSSGSLDVAALTSWCFFLSSLTHAPGTYVKSHGLSVEQELVGLVVVIV